MVIINDSVLNVLNRIYLDSITHKGYAPDLYFEAIDALNRLDTSVLSVYANSVNNAPFNWKRENGLVLRVQHLLFLYQKEIDKYNNKIIIVHEIAENGMIVTEELNKVISLITRVEKFNK